MIDHEARERQLADRLLAEDRAMTGVSAESSEAARWFAVMLAHEQATEQRIRSAAVWAWGTVFASIALFGVATFAYEAGAHALSEAGKAGRIVARLMGGLALFLAVLMTVVWLFRSRSASLAAIERRLGDLERLLRVRGSGGRG